jgi:hypothetical protein
VASPDHETQALEVGGWGTECDSLNDTVVNGCIVLASYLGSLPHL